MRIKVMLLACMVVLVTAMSASAETECFISVTGASQGPFKTELPPIPVKGLDGSRFLGQIFDYEVVIPRDTVTIGKPMHKPIRIQKAWGPASLQFYAASLNGELLTVTIDFWTQDKSGVKGLDHTVKLHSAVVASFSLHSENPQLPVTNIIELVPQKVEIIDHKGKASIISKN